MARFRSSGLVATVCRFPRAADGDRPRSEGMGSWSQCMRKNERGLFMNQASQIPMTNDKIRKNDEIRMTKPATALPRPFRHSGFGFLSSLVIGHSSFNGLQRNPEDDTRDPVECAGRAKRRQRFGSGWQKGDRRWEMGREYQFSIFHLPAQRSKAGSRFACPRTPKPPAPQSNPALLIDPSVPITADAPGPSASKTPVKISDHRAATPRIQSA
jgi:hypothetical protein